MLPQRSRHSAFDAAHRSAESSKHIKQRSARPSWSVASQEVMIISRRLPKTGEHSTVMSAISSQAELELHPDAPIPPMASTSTKINFLIISSPFEDMRLQRLCHRHRADRRSEIRQTMFTPTRRPAAFVHDLANRDHVPTGQLFLGGVQPFTASPKTELPDPRQGKRDGSAEKQARTKRRDGPPP